MLPAHFAPVYPGLMKIAAPATVQGREVPAAAGACLRWGEGMGKGGGSGWAPAINVLCYQVSGSFVIARDVLDAFYVLLVMGLFNIV